MDLSLISIPYDSALRGVRMGAGPESLLNAGLANRLMASGHSVQIEAVEHKAEPPAEIRTAFELMRGVAARVHRAVESGRFPIVLSGNCNVAVGTRGGLGDGVGVVWFDAHGDFHTPETTTGGFLDGSGLAILTGLCWRPLLKTVPGFRPVPEADIVLAGARDFEPVERTALDRSGVVVLSPDAVRNAKSLRSSLGDMAGRVSGAYVHLDLDVLDPAYGCANDYAAPAGLSPEELIGALQEVRRRLPIRALGVASYDPATDTAGTIREAALRSIEAVLTAQMGGAV
jgi:arginase